MKNIELLPEEVARVHEFVGQLATKQAQRGSRDRYHRDTGEHRFGQNVIGKLGEVAATHVVGGDVDFTVWVAGSRGIDQFEPDIVTTKTRPKHRRFAHFVVHVKTTHLKYINDPTRISWTIDRTDPLLDGGDGSEIIVLMFAEESGRAAAFGWVFACDVAELWKPTINLPHKLAIYYLDLLDVVQRFEND